MSKLRKRNLKEVEVSAEVAAGELRQDLLTGKWVVVAPGRAKRPRSFATQTPSSPKEKYVDDCPFCNLADYPQEPDVMRLPNDPENWQVHIFGNKYPAFAERDELKGWQEGPYRTLEAVGYHEILATRWHDQVEPLLSEREWLWQLEALVLRYRQLKEKASVNYIQIIKNHGPAAGASLAHPHHQLFTLPVLPSDVADMLWGAERYYRVHGEDVFTVLVRHEQEMGSRVVFENEAFIAFCPYASRVPYAVTILPKLPQPFFEAITPEGRELLAEVMREVLGRLYVGLEDPSYNYFIHSAPCDETGFVCDASVFGHFRWHIEIMPRSSSWGGLELGTGLEVVTTLPEEAARFLRDQSLPRRM